MFVVLFSSLAEEKALRIYFVFLSQRGENRCQRWELEMKKVGLFVSSHDPTDEKAKEDFSLTRGWP